MRISDWSSDVCSSDLRVREKWDGWVFSKEIISCLTSDFSVDEQNIDSSLAKRHCLRGEVVEHMGYAVSHAKRRFAERSEEHTSELQSLMRISYAVLCLKKKQENKAQTDKSDDNISNYTHS